MITVQMQQKERQRDQKHATADLQQESLVTTTFLVNHPITTAQGAALLAKTSLGARRPLDHPATHAGHAG